MEIRDVEYPETVVRYITLGSVNSWFTVAVSDQARKIESTWSDLYNSDIELTVSIATGATREESLQRLHQTSVPGAPPLPPVPPRAAASAVKGHAVPVRQAMDIFALYRAKPTMVMWATEGDRNRNRLRQFARAWGFTSEERRAFPVFVRSVVFEGANDTNQT